MLINDYTIFKKLRLDAILSPDLISKKYSISLSLALKWKKIKIFLFFCENIPMSEIMVQTNVSMSSLYRWRVKILKTHFSLVHGKYNYNSQPRDIYPPSNKSMSVGGNLRRYFLRPSKPLLFQFFKSYYSNLTSVDLFIPVEILDYIPMYHFNPLMCNAYVDFLRYETRIVFAVDNDFCSFYFPSFDYLSEFLIFVDGFELGGGLSKECYDVCELNFYFYCQYCKIKKPEWSWDCDNFESYERVRETNMLLDNCALQPFEADLCKSQSPKSAFIWIKALSNVDDLECCNEV